MRASSTQFSTTGGRAEQILRRALANPIKARRELTKLDCEASLYTFIQTFWTVLEPGRPFVPNWHVEVLCDHLQAVTRGEIERLLMNVPPGFMKSLLVNVFWPAWEWGPQNMAHRRYVNFSYSASLTVRDNRRLRRLITSPEFQSMWRVRLVSDENNKVKFETDRTGFSLATSVGGVGTGERGDVVRLDDPHNVKEGESEAVRQETVRWFEESLSTRMVDPERSAIVVIMQRVHESDVSGHILSRPGQLGYVHVMLPMEYEPERRCYTSLPRGTGRKMRYVGSRQRWLPEGWAPTRAEDLALKAEYDAAPTQTVFPQDARRKEGQLLFPTRFSERVVERDKMAMGDYAVAGQFQQRPSPRGGLMFKRHWFRIWEAGSAVPSGTVWVRHWDLAATKERVLGRGARTVGLLLGRTPDMRLVIADMLPLMAEAEEVARTIKNTADQDRQRWGRVEVSLPQDPGQAGKAQVASISKQLQGHVFHAEPETGDKITRAEPIQSQAQAGNVYLMEGAWNVEFLDEVTKFPTGKRKDVVDSLSGAYARLLMRPSGNIVTLAVRGHH